MALTPKERADFDEIVMRLRREDARIGEIGPRRQSAALVVCVVVAVLVFGLGVALIGQGPFGPLLIITAMLGGGLMTGWLWSRSRRPATP